MMREWNQPRKARFRGDVLTVLSGNHLSQQSRMDDVMLGAALQRRLWDVGIRDVVTILQEMSGRGWVKFLQCPSGDGRVYLHTVEICPDGQDLVDGTTAHPAVRFD